MQAIQKKTDRGLDFILEAWKGQNHGDQTGKNYVVTR